MKVENLSAEELRRGYSYRPREKTYRCAACTEEFSTDEVYPVEGRYLLAEAAIRHHMESEHGDYTQNLIRWDSKYNALTQKQKQLLLSFSSGMADKDIARETGVSVSTVRHQKFMFREKAKQARLYLAIYEAVFDKEGGSGIMPIHDDAKMVDERYVVTQEEREHILNTSFASLEPLRLQFFSPKEKKKVVILTRIAQEFQQGREYSEKEINGILAEIFEDYATLRRYLIQYGFMQRTKDCSKYWLT